MQALLEDTVTLDLRAGALQKTDALVAAGGLISALYCNVSISLWNGKSAAAGEPQGCLSGLSSEVLVRAEAAVAGFRRLNTLSKVSTAFVVPCTCIAGFLQFFLGTIGLVRLV